MNQEIYILERKSNIHATYKDFFNCTTPQAVYCPVLAQTLSIKIPFLDGTQRKDMTNMNYLQWHNP